MKFTKPLAKKLILPAIGMMTMVDGILYIYTVTHRSVPPSLILRQAEITTDFPMPGGYDSEGKRIEPHFNHGSGWVIRYASSECPYSRRDEELWNPLSAEFKKKGFRVLIVLPTFKDRYAKDAPEIDGDLQLAYVDPEWVGRYRLSVTPTLLVFDSVGRLTWFHQGMLSSVDVGEALGSVLS